VTDCAPLIAAERLGLFSKHRLDVTLHCEVGWASIREKLVHGQLDGAHAVAGLILALRLGLQGSTFPVISPFIFSLQGNAITLSKDLWNRGVRDAGSLRKLIRSQKSKLLTFGVVTHFSAHNFLMRRWLESGGINPGADVRIIPFPPSLMPENLANGLLDGFCAGEPWNSQAVATGSGWCPATSADLDPLHPEKALILSENFAAQNPDVVATLCKVFTKACAYCDAPENRPQVVEWLVQSGYFTPNRAVLAASLVGPFETGASPARSADSFHIFSRHGANTPTADHARWLLDACRHHDLLPAASQQQAARELAKAWSLPSTPQFTTTKKQKQPQSVL
jgi:NitT/TauT family transport system ATP-binding protein